MITAGIDVGSAAIKVAVVDTDGQRRLASHAKIHIAATVAVRVNHRPAVSVQVPNTGSSSR